MRRLTRGEDQKGETFPLNQRLFWVIYTVKNKNFVHFCKTNLLKFISVNIYVLKDFRYMKIHIFALRWKDEIKGSSQLRTLLKRVVVNRT